MKFQIGKSVKDAYSHDDYARIKDAIQYARESLTIDEIADYRHTHVIFECHTLDTTKPTIGRGQIIQYFCADGTYYYKIRIAYVDPMILVFDTIFHEMRHLQQYVNGDLVGAVGGSIWRGKFYEPAQTFQEYENFEWEVDARAAASRMIDDYGRRYSIFWHIKEAWKISKFYRRMRNVLPNEEGVGENPETAQRMSRLHR